MENNSRMLNRINREQLEREQLAPFAMKSADSLGREYKIEQDHLRTEFQRDRDRIIHSSNFRKLEYKTQVYMVHYGDYFRTRITHTMEVAQIARALAVGLRLNTDLTEAIALAHDVGHTPFGHSGETALQKILEDQGGFEHNEQGLRVVEQLEERYPEIPGLNLTFEVREGIIKHATAYDSPTVPERFRPDWAPLLESQICDVADEIAYNNHDIDDALKMGLITEADLEAVPWVWQVFENARAKAPANTHEKFIKFMAVGTIIDMHVEDVLRTTEENIAQFKIQSVDDVRKLTNRRIASFSSEMARKNHLLKDFLMANVYRHPRVVRMATKAERFIEKMFKLYVEIPEQLPIKYQKRIASDGLTRTIIDYISGMTDRYLLDEYSKAFESTNYAL
jgi:dGTPase